MSHAPAPRAPARPRAARWLVPLLATAAIVAWQLAFFTAAPPPRREHAMTASMGTGPDAAYFFYFWWHYGLFPVGAIDAPTLGPTRADADRFVAGHGDRLRMDFGLPVNTPRFGDYGKLFTFVPGVWLGGSPATPSAIPFDALLFVTALVATWWAFHREGRTLLGTALVVLAGSNPFQVLETYQRGNVFSLPISVALLALAAHLPLLTGRRAPGRFAWVLPLASGVLLASVREVRAEAVLIGASLAATYLFARGASWRARALFLLLFAVGWDATSGAWSRYWRHEFDGAQRFVARAGGVPYRARPATHHAFWHAAWCGLGDYGTDKGFAWDDRAAFRWATTFDAATNPDPLRVPYSGGWYFDSTADGVHAIAPTDLPAYNAKVRARVLAAIGGDPVWYAGVLARRALAILRDATPASVTIGPYSAQLPGAGWLLPLALVAALLARRRDALALLLFPLPLSALALLVYSGRGTTFYGIAHLVTLALAIEAIAGALRARRAAPEPTIPTGTP